MLITTQYTPDYKPKADLLAESVAKHWPDRFIPIEFEPQESQTYRTDWPKNRPSYASMQAGEFVNRSEFADVPDDEIIICIDADTVMNRPFTAAELTAIEWYLQEHHFLSVYGAYPATKLIQVVNNLGNNKHSNGLTTWDSSHKEFTASILIGRKKHFNQLFEHYNYWLNDLTTIFDHHAATQLMINYIGYTYFSIGILQKTYQCGAWYDGCTEQDAMNAVFNHTK